MLTLARRFTEMSRKSVHDTPTIQSLDRGLAILEAVAESPVPVPLKQLTDLIGIDRSSVFRLANTLRQRRFLANPTGSNDYWENTTQATFSIRSQCGATRIPAPGR